MTKLIWALVCRRVLTDKETNTVSYIDGIEELKALKLPSACPPLVVGTLWKRDANDKTLTMRVRVSMGDKEVLTFEAPEIAMSGLRHRVNVQMGGFPIDDAGELTFAVEQLVGKTWKETARVPVDIQVAEGSKADGTSDAGRKVPRKNRRSKRTKRPSK